jgi:hypothetical protein
MNTTKNIGNLSNRPLNKQQIQISKIIGKENKENLLNKVVNNKIESTR